MPRLFIALSLPEDLAMAVARLCVGLPGVRWTPAEELHLTLRFIGEVDHPTFYEIGEALAGISHPPLELALKGLGTFPVRGPPQSIWAGVAAPEALAGLRRRIERTLRGAGVEPERRSFTPHVTIARVREPLPEARFGSWLARRALFSTPACPVQSFELVSSVLRPEGAEHCVEACYDFVTGVMERV